MLDGHLRFNVISARRIDVCYIKWRYGLRVFFNLAHEDREEPGLFSICQPDAVALVFVKQFK